MSVIRDFALRRLQTAMAKKARIDLSGSAIVFAPHPDDETLGCGGTIIRKKQTGASIKIVFMTDGSGSHRRFMAAVELKQMRRCEALAAAQALGVEKEDVLFLGFEDGQLKDCFEPMRDRLSHLIAEHKPEQIYVTHPQEPHSDHSALYAAAIASIQHMSTAPLIYAYPVWYWRQWPWTQLASDSKKETLRIAQTTLGNYLGARAFSDFQYSVDIESVLAQKRAALSWHASQMERFADNPDWPVLSDVSNGNFLDCFFQPYETFYRPDLSRKGSSETSVC